MAATRTEVDDISKAALARALRRMRRSHPNDLGWKLLAAHLEAPRRTVSWRALGGLMGWASAEPVKLHYGRFARLLGREMGVPRPSAGFWLHLLADWGPASDERGHTTFRVRSQVVQAFRELGPSERRAIATEPRVHLLQAGVSNGDQAWIDSVSAGSTQKGYTPWVAPRTVAPGDMAVLYIQGIGIYATGTLSTWPRPRRDWERRYGAHLDNVWRIDPPISLATIRRRLPALRWANYPRSIHTLSPADARGVVALITERSRTGLPDRLDLSEMSLEELRATAIAGAKRSLPPLLRHTTYRQRSGVIRHYVLNRAGGVCEACGKPGPFKGLDGSPYLEPHHLTRVADGGADHPAHVAAVCPTCHARVHHGAHGKRFNERIAKQIAAIERE